MLHISQNQLLVVKWTLDKNDKFATREFKQTNKQNETQKKWMNWRGKNKKFTWKTKTILKQVKNLVKKIRKIYDMTCYYYVHIYQKIPKKKKSEPNWN